MKCKNPREYECGDYEARTDSCQRKKNCKLSNLAYYSCPYMQDEQMSLFDFVEEKNEKR